jgi:16S rRNA (adenine1518-N6/adenine1519-N6)-dimethyltransferase
MTNKSLGQHFLRNREAIRTIVATLDPQPDKVVIEIGPGHGELTMAIRSKEPGARIIGIEKDEKLCGHLKEMGVAGLEIIHGDALATLPKLINDPQSTIHNYKIVGNIPYYITGHLLRIIGELPNEKKPERCVFTIQKEVAERIAAKEGDINRLAASVAYWADAKIVMNLAREDFKPMPKVKSAVIVLNRKTKPAFPDQHRYYAAVRALFAQPRKTILNNLSQAKVAAGAKLSGKNKEKLADELRNIGILPEARPQDLAVEDIAKIAEHFF